MSTRPGDVLPVAPSADAVFDHDWSLAELMPEGERPRLLRLLEPLIGVPPRIVDGGQPPDAADTHAAPIQTDIEPLGWLLGPSDQAAALDAAAALLRSILVDRQRYHMASALHVESVQADFDALRDKHEALIQSEARYRALSEQLEARVAEQVAVIETRQRQLYQAERLASVGQLAAGVAHEINNPIGFVRSNLNSARTYLREISLAVHAAMEGEPEPWKNLDAEFVFADFADLLKDSIDGIDRVAAIVRDLKGFSAVDQDDVAVIDLGASLDELCRLLTPRLPPGAKLNRIGEATSRLSCRPGQLQQALFNVLDNALKAIAPGGQIYVRCRRGDQHQLVDITDDGCGVAPEHLSRVFDPFFTTRPVGAGVGLGLTLARDVVLAQHGTIELHSQVGKGTRVSISLPLIGMP